MTDQFQEQISVFVDDELSADECEFFVRRLQREPESRSRLIRYHMIGAAMRGELRGADTVVLRRRLQDALTGASRPRETARSRARRWVAFAKPTAGLGIAASVAVVAVWALQSASLRGVAGPEAAVVDTGPMPTSAQSPDAPSYVVPLEPVQRRLVSPPIRLTNYLMHHSEYASHLSRTAVHSNVVATGQPELTEEEEDSIP